MSMPLRKGAWMFFTSAVEAAPQRTASRKASSLSGGSKPVGFGQGDLLDDLGPPLDLPYDLQFFAQAVVLDRGKGEQVLRAAEGGLEGDRGQRAGAHVVDDPLPGADADQLALFGRAGDGHGHACPSGKECGLSARTASQAEASNSGVENQLQTSSMREADMQGEKPG